MEKFKSVNYYVKEGSSFVVFTTNDGKSYSININFLNYVLQHPRYLGGKNDNKKNN